VTPPLYQKLFITQALAAEVTGLSWAPIYTRIPIKLLPRRFWLSVSSQICLPGLRAGGGAGAGARTADQGQAADRGEGGLRPGCQIRLAFAALSLYRQAQMLLAQGLDIKRAILAFWVGHAAAELGGAFYDII
jgi:hypothetical protein